MNPSAPIRLLLIENDPSLSAPLHHILMDRLALRLFDLVAVPTLAAAFREMKDGEFDLVLMDLDPKDESTVGSLIRFREAGSRVPVIALIA
ncbi:MAG: response regulator transcription factor, partial [Elusimicrobia bacterium]|nr:response regulator transcription factor [Elusimicrobiota bacterium]